jgi:ankyrin repeat protein
VKLAKKAIENMPDGEWELVVCAALKTGEVHLFKAEEVLGFRRTKLMDNLACLLLVDPVAGSERKLYALHENVRFHDSVLLDAVQGLTVSHEEIEAAKRLLEAIHSGSPILLDPPLRPPAENPAHHGAIKQEAKIEAGSTVVSEPVAAKPWKRPHPQDMPNALMLAIDNDDVAEVVKLLAAGASTRIVNGRGEGPLHRVNSLSMAQVLLSAGASVQERTKQGLTPIHVAKNGDIAQALIDARSEVNASDLVEKVTDIQDGSRFGRARRDLVEYEGLRPLHLACWHDRSDVVSVLLTAGADPNAETKVGKTPLHMAKSHAIVTELINAGAEVNARDSRGNSPLHFARDTTIARALIRAGADVCVAANDGTQPLHQQAWSNSPSSIEVIRILVAAGADPSTESGRMAPLEIALQEKKYELFRALIELGASPNYKDRSKQCTRLHEAVRRDDLNLAELLLESRADVSIPDSDGNCPIHSAGSAAMVSLLLRYGANPNALDKDGRPPLWNASQPSIAAALISGGADLAYIDPVRGVTLGFFVGRMGRAEILRMLLLASKDAERSQIVSSLEAVLHRLNEAVAKVLLEFK